MTKTYATIGTDVVGTSWTALFLAHGHPVRAFDPTNGAEDRLSAYVNTT